MANEQNLNLKLNSPLQKAEIGLIVQADFAVFSFGYEPFARDSYIRIRKAFGAFSFRHILCRPRLGLVFLSASACLYSIPPVFPPKTPPLRSGAVNA